MIDHADDPCCWCAELAWRSALTKIDGALWHPQCRAEYNAAWFAALVEPKDREETPPQQPTGAATPQEK